MSNLSIRDVVLRSLVTLIVNLGGGIIEFLAAPSTPVLAQQACPSGVTYAGAEAPNSTIKLQMPFLAGEYWKVGGEGSFYGNNFHCNSYNDHYATDWNRANDANAKVLAVVDGTVESIVNNNCTNQLPGLGCYIKITHLVVTRRFMLIYPQ